MSRHALLSRCLVSAPFGNYLRPRGYTVTTGTFTAYARRTGRLLDQDEAFWWVGMLSQVAKTVRYSRARRGWVNKLGLRNPGGVHGIVMRANSNYFCNKIISVHGFSPKDWNWLIASARYARPAGIELNLSCPNVNADTINEARRVVQYAELVFRHSNLAVIAKLPPVDTLKWADQLLDVHPKLILHCCNTVPLPDGRGGLSGQFDTVYPWIQMIRYWHPESTLIAGGGIRNAYHVAAYIDAGADHLSLGSMLFNPLNWFRLQALRRYAERLFPEEELCPVRLS